MYRITAINGTEEIIIHEPSADSDARLLSGELVEEVGQIPSFSFSVLSANPVFGAVSDRKTLIEVVNTITSETEFEGVVLQSTRRMTDSGKVVMSCICEGFLGYLCDTVQPYHHYENYTINEFLNTLLARHNVMTTPDKYMRLGLCDFSGDNTNSKTTAYRTTLDEIKENLIERVGGEVRVRRVNGELVLDFLTQYGVKCSTEIELAKNIRSLEVSSDSANIVTRLIPLGYQPDPGESAERVDISSVNDGKIYIDDEAAIEKYGIIVGKAEFDDITLPENLIAAGREYLENNNRLKKAYAAQVLDLSVLDPDLQGIRAGNTYRFRNSLIGLDEELRLMKRTVDIYKPYAPNVEIGDKAERITNAAVRTARLIEYDMPKQKTDILSSAKATASALIKAGITGYVVVNGDEILVMDTPDKSTATRVWRWNSGGFGYSNTGYDGEYGTAITMDGAIVADFITAGVLRGMEIVNGDSTFHVHEDGTVEASAIDITGGSINIETKSSNLSVIDLRYNGQTTSYQLSVSAYGIVISEFVSGTLKSAVQLFPGRIALVGEGQEQLMTATASGVTLKGGISAGGNVTANRNVVAGENLTVGGELFYKADNGNTYNLSSYLKTGSVSANTVTASTITYQRDGNWYDLATSINTINDTIHTLWDAVFGGD